MIASSSTASAASGLVMPAMQQLQAQRAADQADQKAQALRSQAREAQMAADRQQERARDLRVRSGQAEQDAGAARRNIASFDGVRRVQESYTGLRQQIAEVAREPAPAQASQAAPAVNSEGQTTGTVVSVTA